MSDDLEERLRGWMRDRGATDRSALGALAGHVAVLPPRRRRTPGPLAVAAAVIVALGLAGFALVPRQGSVTSSPSSPVPPDPAAFAGDPRLARCGTTLDGVVDVFEMAHARDYRLHLPAMGLAPELDVDAPAFVAVYVGVSPMTHGGAAPLPGQTVAPPASLAPGHHDLCILVGADPTTAETNVYGDVDIAGLTVTVATGPPPSSTAPPSSSAPESIAPGVGQTTPGPGPAWAGDARSVLECDASPVDLAYEANPDPNQTQGGTPDIALGVMLQRVWALRLPVPMTGFTASTVDGPAHLFVHRRAGRILAAIAVTTWNGGPDGPWVTSSVASCPAIELDPTTTTGVLALGRWVVPDGNPVPGSVFLATPDCYDGTQVRLDGRLYVRIPKGGVDASQLEMTWSRNATLPETAILRGYRSGARRLYSRPDGRAIYLVDGDRVERLPHVLGDDVVRTDCN